MQYNLSEQEARHMEKYRALNPAEQDMVDKFLERFFKFKSDIDRAAAERKAAEEK